MSNVQLIGGIFIVGRKLGSGSFGDIYLVTHRETLEEFAVKIEPTKSKHPQLLYEAKLIKHLQGGQGIANIYFCDTEGDFNVVVMDRLGQSLEDLFNLCNRKFTLSTILQMADQLLLRIEYLHSKNFIHRYVPFPPSLDWYILGTLSQTISLWVRARKPLLCT